MALGTAKHSKKKVAQALRATRKKWRVGKVTIRVGIMRTASGEFVADACVRSRRKKQPQIHSLLQLEMEPHKRKCGWAVADTPTRATKAALTDMMRRFE